MIGETLLQTRQIDSRSAMHLDAIVLGTGPSFLNAIRSPIPSGTRYGCGVVPLFLDVDVYALGDVVHLDHVPSDRPVYATQRVRDAVADPGRFLAYPEDELPHGGSSGGMALSLACRSHGVIGLIGFDGHGKDDAFITGFQELIRYWQIRGKRLMSLMPDSMFHDLLDRP